MDIAAFKKVKPDENGNITEEENDTLIQGLRWLDTIHDFFPVDLTARGEDIRGILSRQYDPAFKPPFTEKNNGVKKFMETLSTNGIAPSSVEKATEAYYNEKFKTIMVGKRSINVKTIIDSFSQKNAKELLASQGISDHSSEADLQLVLTDRTFFKENKSATNFLANVILTFFFGENINPEVYFLIDAASGRLDCMFQEIDQANTIINALTIGDSANTSTTDKTDDKESESCGVSDYANKFKRKAYLPSPNTVPYNDIDLQNPVNNKYRITSNEFTKDKLELWYQSVPGLEFTKQKNASIRFCVKPKNNNDKLWYTEFSILSTTGSPNSGVSVGNLKKIILILNENIDNEAKKQKIFKLYKTITQLNLAKILYDMLDDGMDTDDIIRFLYDYKRAGDHEQVNSAHYLNKTVGRNVILVTGDRLCSLYARLMKQSCIYVHKKEYDMYRFLREEEITPEQQLAQAKELLTSSQGTISTELAAIDSDAIRRKMDEIDAMISESWIETTTTLEDKLYSLVFRCLKKKIERNKTRIEDFRTELDAIVVYNRELSEEETSPETITETVKELNQRYGTFKRDYKEILNVALYIGDELKKDKKKFISNALDYNNEVVKNILKYFADFKAGIYVFKTHDDKRKSEKRTFINSLGGEKYNILIGDFIEFLNHCSSYIGTQPINMETFMEKSTQVKISINSAIAENLKELIIESQSYVIYEPIVTEIVTFFEGELEKINVDAVVEETTDVEMPPVEAVEETEEVPVQVETPVTEVQVEETPVTEVEEVQVEEAPVTEVEETPVTEVQVEEEREPVPMDEDEGEDAMVPSSSMAGGMKIEAIKEMLREKNKEIVEKQNLMFILLKIHLYEWLANTKVRGELSDTIIKKIKEIKKIKSSVFDTTETNSIDEPRELRRILNPKDAALKEIITADDFESILKNRLKYEYHLYYGKTSGLIHNHRLVTDYIVPLLDEYYTSIRVSHMNQLIDNYFTINKDTEFTGIDEIYDFIINECVVYKDDIYDCIYNAHSVEERNETIIKKHPATKRKGENVSVVPSMHHSTHKRKTYHAVVPDFGDFVDYDGGKKRTRKYKHKGNKKTRNRKQKSKNKKTKKLKNRRKHKTRRN